MYRNVFTQDGDQLLILLIRTIMICLSISSLVSKFNIYTLTALAAARLLSYNCIITTIIIILFLSIPYISSIQSTAITYIYVYIYIYILSLFSTIDR